MHARDDVFVRTCGYLCLGIVHLCVEVIRALYVDCVRACVCVRVCVVCVCVRFFRNLLLVSILERMTCFHPRKATASL